jgi:hypothetical protein
MPVRKRLWIDAKAPLRRAVRWTLMIVVLAFAVIGFLQVTRGTAVRHVQGVGSNGVPIGVSEPEFPLMVTMLAGAALAPGHRVEVLLNGDGTYPRYVGRPPIRATVDHAAAVLRRSWANGPHHR